MYLSIHLPIFFIIALPKGKEVVKLLRSLVFKG